LGEERGRAWEGMTRAGRSEFAAFGGGAGERWGLFPKNIILGMPERGEGFVSPSLHRVGRGRLTYLFGLRFSLGVSHLAFFVNRALIGWESRRPQKTNAKMRRIRKGD
jgi:hypothetical protein